METGMYSILWIISYDSYHPKRQNAQSYTPTHNHLPSFRVEHRKDIKRHGFNMAGEGGEHFADYCSYAGESPAGILCLWVCSFGSGALFNGPLIRWSISFISVNIHVAKQWKGFLSVPNRTWKALSAKRRGCWNRAMGNAWVTEMPLWFQ